MLTLVFDNLEMMEPWGGEDQPSKGSNTRLPDACQGVNTDGTSIMKTCKVGTLVIRTV